MDKKRNGFTLIEILVVATIIGLLAAIGITSYTQFNIQARNTRRKADAENVRGALEMYKSNVGNYPSLLDNLTTPPNQYLKSLPTDPKGTTVNNWSSSVYGCTGSPCTTYTITVNLEPVATGNTYFADPYGAN